MVWYRIGMTLGSHQKTVGTSQVHITPLSYIKAVGPFGLDPCAAFPRPWDCATVNISEEDDGLAQPWLPHQFVWCNPPFHRYQVERWIKRLAAHNHGIALLHARTETKWFRHCWEHASAMLFLYNRIIFHKSDGSLQTTKQGNISNSGAPPVLVGFGALAKQRLEACDIPGALVTGWEI